MSYLIKEDKRKEIKETTEEEKNEIEKILEEIGE